MAEEYIKRKDAITAFGNYLGATSVRAHVAAEKILSTVPSEDVKPVVHGHWIWKHRHRGGFKKVSGVMHTGMSIRS